MTLPPPEVLRRVARLHAMMGSTNGNEAETARSMLVDLLAKHGCSWNDVPDILAAARSSGRGSINGNSPAPLRGYFFHSPDGAAYVDLHINGHRQTWPVRGSAFQDHVRCVTFMQTGSALTSAALRNIVEEHEAEARYHGPEREVHLRVARHGGRAYLDLADDQWRVVEVCSDGWRVLNEAPVRFRREPGMLALPVPQRGGTIEELAELLNVRNGDDVILIVMWLLAALRGVGPFPVLAVSGEQGSAKSTLVRMLRSLIDPNVAPLRSLSTTERDLFVSADVSFLQAFDNVSGINPRISDALCRLATGGAFASRQFFKNRGEVAISAMRPTILNGISNVIRRADFADRSIQVALPSIAEKGRRSEGQMMAAFNAARPRILGVLLDAVSRGLRELPGVEPTELGRMADFDMWGRACEPALWPAGSFRRAYTANRNEAVENSLEADAVAATIRDVAAAHGEWKGTATELLDLLARHADQAVRRADRDWPQTPEALRHRLDRASPSLRKVGIEVSHRRSSDRNRTRTHNDNGRGVREPSEPSRPSERS